MADKVTGTSPDVATVSKVIDDANQWAVREDNALKPAIDALVKASDKKRQALLAMVGYRGDYLLQRTGMRAFVNAMKDK